MRRPTQNLEPGRAHWRRRTAALTAAGLLLFGAAGARGDDPLDDTDGTEDWDQVAPAASQPAQPAEQDDFRQEISAWQAVSQQWEQARLQYIEERTRHKRVSSMPKVLPRVEKRPVGHQPDADINDDNYNSTAGDDGDWGDPPGSTLLAPAGSLDRAIDSELEESGARNRAAPTAQPGERARPAGDAEPAPSASPSDAAGDDWEEPPAAKPDPKAVEAARKREAVERAKAEKDARLAAEAAEKARVAEEEALRKQAEEDAKRKVADEEARRDKEAAEGAAAAVRFLQEQAERERKEAEALRKKAALEEDAEGQVVDPEIKKELGEEEEEKPEED